MLGGFQVSIFGPYFDSSTDIQGLLVDSGVTFPCVESQDEERRVVYCIMPMVFEVGQQEVKLVLNGAVWNYTGYFTFGEFQFFVFHCLLLDYSEDFICIYVCANVCVHANVF